MNELGKILICGGSDIALVGFFLWSGFAPRWLGRLPGDIRIERGQTVFYFPIVTCVVLSLILSISRR